MKVIEWLKNVKTKFVMALLAGMAVCVLTQGIWTGGSTLAWWGTLYPKFTFAKTEKQEGKVKISFWLAKALNW